MLSLNHVPHAELQSPLDAFAAKHCPKLGSGKSHGSSEGREGIPEIEFEIDEEERWNQHDNTSPLSALMKRQFPHKGVSERRLFE